MPDWTPLGRLRTFQAEIAQSAGGYNATVTVQGWGRGLNLTLAEFNELLDAAELGEHAARAADLIARRHTTGA